MKIAQLVVQAAFALVTLELCSSHAQAQCAGGWSKGFEYAGFDAPTGALVEAFVVFDDGSGPALYAGGTFTLAGGTPADYIARWDGDAWSPVGGGTSNVVTALAVFDDGSGSALYAGGHFDMAGGTPAARIAKWDGAQWSPVGNGFDGPIYALAVYDDGAGPALYAGGNFGTSLTPKNIARWDGTDWVRLSTAQPSDTVLALAVHDDGAGPSLYVGGNFSTIGAGSSPRIARWDGTDWFGVGSGLSNSVFALIVYDDGSGAALHAGGAFSGRVAKWTGALWSPLPGITSNVLELGVFDAGAGPELYAGTDESVTRWSGSTWTSPGGGVASNVGINTTTTVRALVAFDDGSGLRLFVGGDFDSAGETLADTVAAWDGVAWHGTFGSGEGLGGYVQLTQSVGDPTLRGVTCMTVHDDGSGASLFAGGGFAGVAGRVFAPHIARWDGAHWNPLGAGVNDVVHALQSFDDGTGPALYVGGRFTASDETLLRRLARWDGTDWSEVGGGTSGDVHALAIFDDGSGPALYVGGSFGVVGGGTVSAPWVARWDGSAWSPLGTSVNNVVRALAVHDDGSGPALYAAGDFTHAGALAVNKIARWNGSTWSALAMGINSAPAVRMRALCTFDDGSGTALYAAGNHSSASGVAARLVAKWDGANWSALGNPSDMSSGFWIDALHVHDDGSGPALYVGGSFSITSINAYSVARWNGANWSALSPCAPSESCALGAYAVNGSADAFGTFDDGTGGGPELFVGGVFSYADGGESKNIARWGACRPGNEYCFGDAIDARVTTDCPCGNFGSSGHGCANSNPTLGGARLTAVGTTTPNTVVLTCTGMPNNNLATFWRGTQNIAAGQVYHDGIQCAAGTIIRFAQQTVGQEGNPSFTAAATAVALAPGSTRYYQVLYRNPAAGFCPPGSFNFSNGYQISW